MIRIVLLAMISSLLLALAVLAQGRSDDERTIVLGERQWVESSVSGDVTVPQRLLADDFVGVDPDGKLYDKAKEIANTREEATEYASNHLNPVKVRFYGDTAIAQGSETWEKRSGEPKRGQLVWTDTWVRMNGRWQVVAAQDLLVPAPATTKQ